MDLVFILGLVASIVVTIAYVPQVIHTMKLKHMKGISRAWLTLSIIGSVIYIAYGWFLSSIPIILSSIAVGFMTAIILYHKIKYK